MPSSAYSTCSPRTVLCTGWAVPGMGVSGIVRAPCARVFGGLLIVGGFARGFHGLRLSPGMDAPRRDRPRILRIGIPAAADGALAWVGIFLFLMVVSRGTAGVADDVTLAAHVVGVRVEALTYLPADAWGFAAAAMVGQALGAGDPERAQKSGHAAVFQCGLLAGVMSVFTTSPPSPFTPSCTAIRRSSRSASRRLSCWPCSRSRSSSARFTCTPCGARGTRVIRCGSTCSEFSSCGSLSYGCGVLLGGGLVGAWIGMCSDLGIRAVLATVRYVRGAWVKTVV